MSSGLPSYGHDSKSFRTAHPSRSTGSTFRRRRLVWSSILVLTALFGFLYFSSSGLTTSFSLPSNLKDGDTSNAKTLYFDYKDSGKDSQNSEAGGKKPRIQEIHGLLHFLTSERTEGMSLDRLENYASTEEGLVDWGNDLDLNVYSGGVDDEDWPRNVRELMDRYPVIMFSKTYCPFSKKAKALLHTYSLTPPPKIIELDLRTDGDILKQLLIRLTGRSTVPNVLLTRRVDGMSIGGSDDIHLLHENGELKKILQQAGVVVNGDV